LRGFEIIKPTPVFDDIRACNLDNGVKQRHRFRKHRGNILSPFDRHLAQAGVRVGVDIKRTANDVHGDKTVIPMLANVEMATVSPQDGRALTKPINSPRDPPPPRGWPRRRGRFQYPASVMGLANGSTHAADRGSRLRERACVVVMFNTMRPCPPLPNKDY
jgi:hypothetical protein